MDIATTRPNQPSGPIRWKLKLWQNLKIQLVTKFKILNGDKTQLKMWSNSKTQILTKLERKNCDKTQKTQIVTKHKNSNCDTTQKLKFWHSSKTQIVSVVIVTVVIVAAMAEVIVTSFNKNNFPPWHPMRCSWGSF